VALVLEDIALVLEDQGELSEAQTLLRRALAIREATQGPEHSDVASTLLTMVEVALGRHDSTAACEHAERAVAILEASEGSPAHLARARSVLARALWLDQGQRARARRLAEQAREAYAVLGELHREELAELDVWLAEHPAP
jgi:hypothetical protein